MGARSIYTSGQHQDSVLSYCYNPDKDTSHPCSLFIMGSRNGPWPEAECPAQSLFGFTDPHSGFSQEQALCKVLPERRRQKLELLVKYSISAWQDEETSGDGSHPTQNYVEMVSSKVWKRLFIDLHFIAKITTLIDTRWICDISRGIA